MRRIDLQREDDFEEWRDAARALASADVPAHATIWRAGQETDDLFAEAAAVVSGERAAAFFVPRGFVDLARTVVCHSDPQRFALLYGALLRLRRNPAMLEDRADPAVRRLEDMAKAVRRDMHKMRAFVRFREVETDEGSRFIAWFEPEHHIVRTNAGFFVRRFATMRWSILTPDISIHWDGSMLSEGPGGARADAPDDDPVEEIWRAYYGSIFNPARMKIGAMLKEMPKRYWKNMPETALIPGLVAGAQARERSMVELSRTQVGGNGQVAWDALRAQAMSCTRCPLRHCATQTVFGEGPVDAQVMLVGEQPGDQEDIAGRPFIGPAGQLLDKALAEAGIDRAKIYVTNAVKHFKFEQRGKRRLHAKPNAGEIEACRWWYDRERELVRPAMTIALGATGARAMLGKAVTISASREKPHRLADGGEGRVTVHPSYLLRIDDRGRAEEEYAMFVKDLRGAAQEF
ncbi:UdgX family uracil-DNA binding protein [Sphingobium phenoxybenzoativorans]|uniref:UdgX family uracil-DNA binding protein n=1 Tax=Sphingobium phenoxybenzoativorans TaxID=1592790 RepID=UPI00087316C0|nr:UdgX family uracil-DNA binding protein [Sphingobium phenoxybenzoativorans]